MTKEPKATFDATYIRDLSEKVYRGLLGDDDVQRMIEKDKDGGVKLRNRAGAYDLLTRAYLKTLGFEPPALSSTSLDSGDQR